MPKVLNYKKGASQMPYLPISLGDMKWSKTGSWRYIRPKYEDKTPPCNQACPAGVDIVRFVTLVEKGKIRDAWLKIKEENPFPGVCGRVCFHPCETHCNRAQYDQSVSINALERFVADAGMRVKSRHLDRYSKKSEKIAIIGSGPAGLSCAYHLARLGYAPEVFEGLPFPGGILGVGIPEYRLPVDILNREIADIEALGVRVRTHTYVDGHFLDRQGREYQAVFVATGAHRSQHLGIGEEEEAGVIPGLVFLRDIRMGRKLQPGARIAVIGGGNTAVDAARSALRLGSRPVVIYRRSQQEMPAFPSEIEEALEEGIEIEFLAQPIRIIRENGKVAALECIRMRLGDADESGRRRPLPVEGSEFTLDVDGVLVAIGEVPDMSLMQDWGPLTLEDVSGWESKGIFLGGDLVASHRTVAHAIGSGKKAALSIDAFLNERSPSQVLEMTQIGETGAVSMRKYLDSDYRVLSRHVVSFDELNTAYFNAMDTIERERAPVKTRVTDFREVNKGLKRQQAQYEAERCFKCGTCNDCENCYVFCPDISVLKNMRKLRHAINYDYCKGCGICFNECPRYAISMEEEEK
jgi:2-oxoacid:acceptor oxidoreductase delta subunit (pyruvate/2-ketoisovalerate family)